MPLAHHVAGKEKERKAVQCHCDGSDRPSTVGRHSLAVAAETAEGAAVATVGHLCTVPTKWPTALPPSSCGQVECPLRTGASMALNPGHALLLSPAATAGRVRAGREQFLGHSWEPPKPTALRGYSDGAGPCLLLLGEQNHQAERVPKAELLPGLHMEHGDPV